MSVWSTLLCVVTQPGHRNSNARVSEAGEGDEMAAGGNSIHLNWLDYTFNGPRRREEKQCFPSFTLPLAFSSL